MVNWELTQRIRETDSPKIDFWYNNNKNKNCDIVLEARDSMTNQMILSA